MDKLDSCFFLPTARVEGDLETRSHPFGTGEQFLSNGRNIVVGEFWLLLYFRLAYPQAHARVDLYHPQLYGLIHDETQNLDFMESSVETDDLGFFTTRIQPGIFGGAPLQVPKAMLEG